MASFCFLFLNCLLNVNWTKGECHNKRAICTRKPKHVVCKIAYNFTTNCSISYGSHISTNDSTDTTLPLSLQYLTRLSLCHAGLLSAKHSEKHGVHLSPGEELHHQQSHPQPLPVLSVAEVPGSWDVEGVWVKTWSFLPRVPCPHRAFRDKHRSHHRSLIPGFLTWLWPPQEVLSRSVCWHLLLC